MNTRLNLALRWLASTALLASTTLYASERPLIVDMAASGDTVTFTVTNSGDQALSVLRWDTPLEPQLSSDVFTIGDGEAKFIGRHIKRAFPLERDYIELQPGQSVSADVALNRFYEIADHASYEVSYSGVISYSALAGEVSAAAKHSVRQLQDMSLAKVTVDLAPAPPTARAQVPSFRSCTVDRQTLINNALVASEQLTIEARDALANLPLEQRATSPRYSQWFGAYTAARYARVQTGMGNAADVMANQVIDFDCGCDEGAFAYVFPNDPFRVYLCRAFWTAPNTGTDSKAGTILHELSHFPEVIGTEDHAYGQTDAAALARTDPDRAVNNADSFEYFMENTPALPIQGDGTTPVPAPEPGDDNYIALVPGTSVAGSVAQGESVLYQSSGVSVLNLTTTSGDADLFVFSDAARTDELCNSRETTVLDSCDLGSQQNVYIRVDGWETSAYTLAVIGDDNDADGGEDNGGGGDGSDTDGGEDGNGTDGGEDGNGAGGGEDGNGADGGEDNSGGFGSGDVIEDNTSSSTSIGIGSLGFGVLALVGVCGVRRRGR